jgi:hypothetical protein
LTTVFTFLNFDFAYWFILLFNNVHVLINFKETDIQNFFLLSVIRPYILAINFGTGMRPDTEHQKKLDIRVARCILTLDSFTLDAFNGTSTFSHSDAETTKYSTVQ